ncbi:MAG: hypothetical protein PHT13_00115 [Methanosarcina sp.]|jgi:hypothetical protein|nr:hypothetical protein [Methanosarcina sp.]
MTIVFEQIAIGLIAGFCSGVASLQLYLKRRAANISDDEMNKLIVMMLAAAEDGDVTKEEFISFVKMIVQFSAN